MSCNNNDNTQINKEQIKHLSREERGKIEAYLDMGCGVREIARKLKRSASTISTEIKRGTVRQLKTGRVEYFKYFAEAGQAIYETNRKNCVCKGLEKYSAVFFRELTKALKTYPRHHSVDTFTQEYKEKHPEEGVPSVKTIYRLIDQEMLELRNIDLPKKPVLRPKNQTPSRPKGTNAKKLGRSIEERPEKVLERIEMGHWEADLVKGKKEQGEPALLTLVERRTRFAIIRKLDNFEAYTCHEALQDLIKEWDVSLFKSITFDNGSEFSEASKLESLSTEKHKIKVYFAHAHSSWERGSNENFNGLLREFVPKGVSIHNFTDEDILVFEEALNKRPRKVLGYQSADTAFEMAA